MSENRAYPAARVLLSKYWGQNDLHLSEVFWTDAMVSYTGTDMLVTLPIEWNEDNKNRLLAMVECPSGKCGACCKYAMTHIRHEDVSRMIAGGVPDIAKNVRDLDKERPYFESKDGCPYLVDNACSIYEHRPEICRIFPLQGPVVTLLPEGQSITGIGVRMKCVSAFNIVKAVIIEEAPKRDWWLVPDLTFLPRYHGEVIDNPFKKANRSESNASEDTGRVQGNKGRRHRGRS